MSKFFSTLIIVVLTFKAYSQVAVDLEKGDKAFDEMIYDEALFFFESANDVQPNDASITRRIGKVYRRIGLPAAAAEWYKKTLDLGSTEANDMLNYAEILKSLGQYDEAIKWYGKYKQKVPTDKRAISHTLDPEYHLDLFADTLKYTSKKLKINNPDPVIGICAYEDKKLLISAVDLELNIQKNDQMQLISYLDIYEVVVGEDFELSNPKKLSSTINTKYHDGPMCYSFDGRSLLITRNNIKKNKGVIDQTGSVNTKIYEAKLTNSGNWMNAVELPFNNDDFSNAHPTITRDGSELYFASNRPGGYGGMDLYLVKKEGAVWGQPINLGPNVNTEGNEMFPFISNIGTLYFASDGHAGLGGLDIFFSEKNQKDEWMIPLNMGVPLNGPQDDFSIYYDDTNDQGYFCSNRSGQGNDDIYFFQFKTLQEMTLNGNISLEDSLVTMEGETVLIETVGSGVISETKIDSKGNFKYVAKPGEQIIVRLANKKYVDAPDSLFTYTVPAIIKDPNANIGRKKLKLLTPLNHVGPLSQYKEPDLTAIALLNAGDGKNQNENGNANKDKDGTTNGTGKKPPIKVVKPDEKIPAKPPVEQKPSEFEQTVSVVNMDSLHIQNIYFDYNKSVLREVDKVILDKIVGLLKTDPSMTVLVQAHCDSRGNRIYNENLSMSRAFAVKAYFISKGISRNRMKINWYGESRQVNNCVDDNAPCSEEEYMMNRRAEFKIIKPTIN